MFNFLEPSFNEAPKSKRKNGVVRKLSVLLIAGMFALSPVLASPVFAANNVSVTSVSQGGYVAGAVVTALKASSATPAAPSSVVFPCTITLDGVPVTLSDPVLNADNRTFLPLRALGDLIGATTDWDATASVARITRGGTSLETFAGAKSLVKNNAELIPLDAPAFIANSRTYLPLRAAAENLGLTVSWNAETKTIALSTGTQVTTTPAPVVTPAPSTATPAPGATDNPNAAAEASYKQRQDNIKNGIGAHGEPRPTQPGTKQRQLSPKGDWEWDTFMEKWVSVYN